MSGMKSRFRPKSQKSPKPSPPQTWCVEIIESEAGWGMRLDERLEFPSEEKAVAYATKFNEDAKRYNTDEHHFHASVLAKPRTTGS
ncbi:hypothetical protein [Diaphorobacter caeni]|uniref:hypothetical protein n=1 Tax=Diaphorobacter caeni TaxID=2784387 RepID=UPI00188EA489|nr:hypothetical protein [Diaphorobacter caeni]MBF5007718.1 hypothetical protein [Diaphorobacter caeni]